VYDNDLVVRPGVQTHRSPTFIGSREAERMLGISRAVLNRLARTGQLPGTLIEKPGIRRGWRFKVADVFRLKQSGTALRRPPHRRRIRVAWVRMWGPIPKGLTVICRDGNPANTAATNLALVPLSERLKAVRRHLRPKPSIRIHRWTRQQRAMIRACFASRATEELAK
jgi:hypothetical protein